MRLSDPVKARLRDLKLDQALLCPEARRADLMPVAKRARK
jgi:hypothetical protein